VKKVWIAERLNELRQMKPPLPLEACLIRAKKDWIEHKRKEKAGVEEDHAKDWPPMVLEAQREAEEEARKAGKAEEEAKEAGMMAAGYALKVAISQGIYKMPEDPDDPRTTPLFFQKRIGLEKALQRLQREDS